MSAKTNDLASRIDWSKFDAAYDDKFAQFASRRSVVYSTKGVVACSQPLAAEAGLEILRAGGNAADAAVGIAAALNVTEPVSCGIGGDAFCLFYDAKTSKITALNGSGRSPAALTLEKARELGITEREIPLTNLNSVTVPGAVAAFEDAIMTFGSGQLSLEDVLLPAITLAEEGFPVSEVTARSWQKSEKLLQNASPSGSEMLVNGGAPAAGQIFRNATLGSTLRKVAKEGKDGFYKGRVAAEIVKLVQSKGGVLTLDDLASHKTTIEEPISYTYHNSVTLHECAPNGQGLVALIALGILDALQESGTIRPIAEMKHNSTEYLHALVEATRYAFADARAYVADPAKVNVPVKELLSKDYLKSRAELFNPKQAVADVRKGSPLKSSDTVYLSAADAQGNACSFIFSNYAGFGTGAIPAGCGFTLQNRGSNFVLDEKHANCLRPNARPYHTIIPAMATKGKDLLLSYGVMGGFMQPQGHVQVLLNMLHRGFGPQSALDAPRFCISAGMPDVTDNQADAGDINSQVFFEDGIDPKVVEELQAMGHDAVLLKGHGRGLFGRGQVIQKKIDKVTGRLVWAAGSDPRADGHAVPQI